MICVCEQTHGCDVLPSEGSSSVVAFGPAGYPRRGAVAVTCTLFQPARHNTLLARVYGWQDRDKILGQAQHIEIDTQQLCAGTQGN